MATRSPAEIPPGYPSTNRIGVAAGGSPIGWTTGRVIALIAGCLALLVSLAALAAGGVATWADNHRTDGYVSTSTDRFHSAGYAIVSERLRLGEPGGWADWPASVLGTVRLRATATQPGSAVFVGVGRSRAVDRYLSGVARTRVAAFGTSQGTVQFAGHAPAGAPVDAAVWRTHASGTGTQSITFRPSTGQWSIVVMNASGGSGVNVTADVGATVPSLGWISAVLLAGGAVLLVGAVVLIALPVRRASRYRPQLPRA